MTSPRRLRSASTPKPLTTAMMEQDDLSSGSNSSVWEPPEVRRSRRRTRRTSQESRARSPPIQRRSSRHLSPTGNPEEYVRAASLDENESLSAVAAGEQHPQNAAGTRSTHDLSKCLKRDGSPGLSTSAREAPPKKNSRSVPSSRNRPGLRSSSKLRLPAEPAASTLETSTLRSASDGQHAMNQPEPIPRAPPISDSVLEEFRRIPTPPHDQPKAVRQAQQDIRFRHAEKYPELYEDLPKSGRSLSRGSNPFEVGDRVEVWSKEVNGWCRASVAEVKSTKIAVRYDDYQLGDGLVEIKGYSGSVRLLSRGAQLRAAPQSNSPPSSGLDSSNDDSDTEREANEKGNPGELSLSGRRVGPILSENAGSGASAAEPSNRRDGNARATKPPPHPCSDQQGVARLSKSGAAERVAPLMSHSRKEGATRTVQKQGDLRHKTESSPKRDVVPCLSLGQSLPVASNIATPQNPLRRPTTISRVRFHVGDTEDGKINAAASIQRQLAEGESLASGLMAQDDVSVDESKERQHAIPMSSRPSKFSQPLPRYGSERPSSSSGRIVHHSMGDRERLYSRGLNHLNRHLDGPVHEQGNPPSIPCQDVAPKRPSPAIETSLGKPPSTAHPQRILYSHPNALALPVKLPGGKYPSTLKTAACAQLNESAVSKQGLKLDGVVEKDLTQSYVKSNLDMNPLLLPVDKLRDTYAETQRKMGAKEEMPPARQDGLSPQGGSAYRPESPRREILPSIATHRNPLLPSPSDDVCTLQQRSLRTRSVPRAHSPSLHRGTKADNGHELGAQRLTGPDIARGAGPEARKSQNSLGGTRDGIMVEEEEDDCDLNVARETRINEPCPGISPFAVPRRVVDGSDPKHIAYGTVNPSSDQREKETMQISRDALPNALDGVTSAVYSDGFGKGEADENIAGKPGNFTLGSRTADRSNSVLGKRGHSRGTHSPLRRGAPLGRKQETFEILEADQTGCRSTRGTVHKSASPRQYRNGFEINPATKTLEQPSGSQTVREITPGQDDCNLDLPRKKPKTVEKKQPHFQVVVLRSELQEEEARGSSLTDRDPLLQIQSPRPRETSGIIDDDGTRSIRTYGESTHIAGLSGGMQGFLGGHEMQWTHPAEKNVGGDAMQRDEQPRSHATSFEPSYSCRNPGDSHEKIQSKESRKKTVAGQNPHEPIVDGRAQIGSEYQELPHSLIDNALYLAATYALAWLMQVYHHRGRQIEAGQFQEPDEWGEECATLCLVDIGASVEAHDSFNAALHSAAAGCHSKKPELGWFIEYPTGRALSRMKRMYSEAGHLPNAMRWEYEIALMSSISARFKEATALCRGDTTVLKFTVACAKVAADDRLHDLRLAASDPTRQGTYPIRRVSSRPVFVDSFQDSLRFVSNNGDSIAAPKTAACFAWAGPPPIREYLQDT